MADTTKPGVTPGTSETVTTASSAATRAWAEAFASTLSSGSIVAFFGDLGAGKTVLAKGIGRGLGVREEIISPTFNYLLEYAGVRLPLYHADLYRVADARIFSAMGLDEYFDKPGVFLIEWAERIADILPQHSIRIYLERGAADHIRRITIYRPPA